MELFEQNSPFYAKNVSEYRTQTDILGVDLDDLIAQTKRFCKNANAQALSAISLGEHFVRIAKNCAKCDPLLMDKLHAAFTTIASSQKQLVNMLQSSFLDPLDTFYCENITKMQLLESEYHARSISYDNLISKYLQLSDNRGAFDIFDTNASKHSGYMSHTELAKRSLDIVLEKKMLEMTRYDLMQCINASADKCTFELPSILLSSYEAIQQHFVDTADVLKKEVGDKFVQGKMERIQKSNDYAKKLNETFAHRNEMENALDAVIEHVKSNIYSEQTEIFAGSVITADHGDISVDDVKRPGHVKVMQRRDSGSAGHAIEDNAQQHSASSQLHRFGTSIMIGLRASRASIDPTAKVNNPEESNPPTTTPVRAKRSNSFAMPFNNPSVRSPSPAQSATTTTDEVSVLSWESKVNCLEYNSLENHFSKQVHVSKNIVKEVS